MVRFHRKLIKFLAGPQILSCRRMDSGARSPVGVSAFMQKGVSVPVRVYTGMCRNIFKTSKKQHPRFVPIN